MSEGAPWYTTTHKYKHKDPTNAQNTHSINTRRSLLELATLLLLEDCYISNR